MEVPHKLIDQLYFCVHDLFDDEKLDDIGLVWFGLVWFDLMARQPLSVI